MKELGHYSLDFYIDLMGTKKNAIMRQDVKAIEMLKLAFPDIFSADADNLYEQIQIAREYLLEKSMDAKFSKTTH
jgi:hypothetical protein